MNTPKRPNQAGEFGATNKRRHDAVTQGHSDHHRKGHRGLFAIDSAMLRDALQRCGDSLINSPPAHVHILSHRDPRVPQSTALGH